MNLCVIVQIFKIPFVIKMSKALTCQYIEAFTSKNLEKIEHLLHDQVVLEDPVVKRVEGKLKVLAAIKAIFEGAKNLEFSARNIFQEEATTLIEFKLIIDNTILTGIDVIEWEDGKLRELRAYLDIPKA